MVSGNILAGAHGGVGYLQPRGRVSSPSSLCRNLYNTVWLYIIQFTDKYVDYLLYMNVNFNKMLETYAQYLYLIHIHKQIIKSGGSSSEHYF